MDIIVTSFLAFASTNIDDLFILALFFGDKRFSVRDICWGQYLGIGLLVTLSYLGAHLGRWIDLRYIGLLGFIPIYLGIRQFCELFSRSGSKDPDPLHKKINLSQGFWAVSSVTFGNGGDNIGTYIPLFSTLDNSQLAVMLFIFSVMVGIWLITANYLARHPMLAKTIDRYGHLITPVVLFLLGVYILIENRSLTLFD